MAILYQFFKFDQALLSDENIVVPEQIGHMETLRRLHSDVLEVSRGELEIAISRFSTSQETELVLFER